MSYAKNPDRALQRELSSEEFLMLVEKMRQWLTEDQELHAQAQEFALSNVHEFMGENAPSGGEQRFEWSRHRQKLPSAQGHTQGPSEYGPHGPS